MIVAIAPIILWLCIELFELSLDPTNFSFSFLPIIECPGLIISLILAIGAKIEDSTSNKALIFIIIYSLLLIIDFIFLCIVIISFLNELKNSNFY